MSISYAQVFTRILIRFETIPKSEKKYRGNDLYLVKRAGSGI